MAAFFVTIGEVITGLVAQMATVTTALISNNLFLLGFGVLVLTILIRVITGLVKKGRGGR